MFNQVKTKLTVIYTLSLLALLLGFMGLLYLLISHEINQKEMGEILSYYQKEKMDFIEDMYDKKDHGLKYEADKAIFYYGYNPKNEFIFGKESLKTFQQWLNQYPESRKKTFSGRVEWKGRHLLLVKKELITGETSHGFVILGMDITSETDLVQNIMWTMFIMTVLLSILYAFMGNYFAGQAMKPIKLAFWKQEKFVSDASHELRTPLSIFYSSIDLLMREEREQLSSLGKEVLQDVKEEADLMNNLISSLLFLARSDQNRLSLVLKEVDLSKLVYSVHKKFLRKIEGDVFFEADITAGIRDKCDEVRIRQLLYILLDNAFRYTKQGKVVLSLTEDGNRIIISIVDTGCGIAEEELPFIFDRFYRSDKSREKGGSGLGLSIAMVIVDAHGGELSAESKVGEGSVFKVTLPGSK